MSAQTLERIAKALERIADALEAVPGPPEESEPVEAQDDGSITIETENGPVVVRPSSFA